MKRKAIVIKCTAAATLPLKSLSGLQGKMKKLNLTNEKRLTDNILRDGFIAPFFVWKGPKGANRVLDGHQRLVVLRKLEKEGYKMPEFPVAYVEASSLRDARRKLLQVVSQYGQVDLDGLADFLGGTGLNLDEIEGMARLPDVGIVDIARILGAPEKMEERDVFPQETENKCPKCGFEF